MHCIPLSWTNSPCNLLFLNLGLYGLVQAKVGVATVLIWDFCVPYTRGGGYLCNIAHESFTHISYHIMSLIYMQ